MSRVEEKNERKRKNLSLSLWYLLSWCSLLRPFYFFSSLTSFILNRILSLDSLLSFFLSFAVFAVFFALLFFPFLYFFIIFSSCFLQSTFCQRLHQTQPTFHWVTSGFLFIMKRVGEGTLFIYLLIDEHSYFLFFSSCIITMFCRKKWDRRAKVVSVVSRASCDSLSLPAFFRTNLTLKGRVCDIWYAEFCRSESSISCITHRLYVSSLWFWLRKRSSFRSCSLTHIYKYIYKHSLV